jgi:hypothetical protein
MSISGKYKKWQTRQLQTEKVAVAGKRMATHPNFQSGQK